MTFSRPQSLTDIQATAEVSSDLQTWSIPDELRERARSAARSGFSTTCQKARHRRTATAAFQEVIAELWDFSTTTESQAAAFIDRVRLVGEEEALEWLNSRTK